MCLLGLVACLKSRENRFSPYPSNPLIPIQQPPKLRSRVESILSEVETDGRTDEDLMARVRGEMAKVLYSM